MDFFIEFASVQLFNKPEFILWERHLAAITVAENDSKIWIQRLGSVDSADSRELKASGIKSLDWRQSPR
jgi:hypothetical protein